MAKKQKIVAETPVENYEQCEYARPTLPTGDGE